MSTLSAFQKFCLDTVMNKNLSSAQKARQL